MTGQEIERVYHQLIPDRSWWGNFPEAWDVIERDLPETADLRRLMPVCARIALHIAGELPRLIFSGEANAVVCFDQVVLNPEILSLQVREKIRSEVFFGQYIHRLGHLCYSRGVYEKYRFDRQQKYFLHLIEDRRIEGKLAQAYPGYYYYLHAARKMVLALALLRAEEELKFPDLDAVRYHYLSTRILYPELLEEKVFRERLAPHANRLRWIDELLDGVGEYALLNPQQVAQLVRDISGRFITSPESEQKMFNFYSQVMMNLPLEVEGAPVDVDVKILDDLFLDLSKTLDLTPANEKIEGDTKGALKRAGSPVAERYRELEAPCGKVDPVVLRRARELAARIRLNFLTFQAKMNKSCVFYEQESGELDEDELYQAVFNPDIFVEELPAPSAMLEIVIMLDLSGSMTDEDKLELQLVLSVALALAFDANPDIRFAVYGHRVKQERVEIVKFYEPGRRLEIGRLFSQEGMYVNADGLAITYALQKFSTRIQNKLLFMISDGTPTAAVGKQDPRIQVREAVRQARRQGVTVLSVGISNFDQSDMYDEFIPYTGPEVTTRLIQWLRRKFADIADGATF